jgi:hypothetical protein
LAEALTELKMTELSIKRKADRETMAAMIAAAVEPIGVAVHCEESVYRPRLIRMTLSLRGVDCHINIDGDLSPHSAFLGHWVSDRRLGNLRVWRSVNQFHRLKATTVDSDFETFCHKVAEGFLAVANEMAFEEAESVA